MTSRRRIGYLFSFALICAGSAGILFSPMIGLHGGLEQRELTATEAVQMETATAIIISTIEVPDVQNSRGLAFMHGGIVLSMVTLFSGVHLLSRLQRRLWRPV